MPFGIKLYKLRLHPPNQRRASREAFMKGGTHDVLDQVENYLLARKGTMVKMSEFELDATKRAEEHKAFVIETVQVDAAKRLISGIIAVGDYGRKGSLKNVETGGLSYARKREDSDLEPFFYRFDIPDGVRNGLFLCGAHGIKNPKACIEQDMKSHFSKSDDMTLSLDPLHDLEALKEYIISGAVPREIEVVGRKQPKDSRQLMKARVGGKRLDEGSDLIVSIKHSKLLHGLRQKIAEAIGDREKVRKLVEVPGLREWESVRAKIQNADGKERWFNLVKPSNSGLSYNVTDEVDYGPDDYPTHSSMLVRSQAIFDEIKDIAFLG